MKTYRQPHVRLIYSEDNIKDIKSCLKFEKTFLENVKVKLYDIKLRIYSLFIENDYLDFTENQRIERSLVSLIAKLNGIVKDQFLNDTDLYLKIIPNENLKDTQIQWKKKGFEEVEVSEKAWLHDLMIHSAGQIGNFSSVEAYKIADVVVKNLISGVKNVSS